MVEYTIRYHLKKYQTSKVIRSTDVIYHRNHTSNDCYKETVAIKDGNLIQSSSLAFCFITRLFIYFLSLLFPFFSAQR